MPKNTEADRILRQQIKQNEDTKRRAQERAMQEDLAKQQYAVEGITRETPIVVRLLAENGYPDMQQVSLVEEQRGFFTRKKVTTIKAGWMIGSYYKPVHIPGPDSYDTIAHINIFLLSDGRFATGGDEMAGEVSLEELKNDTTRIDGVSPATMAYNGLQRLHQRLEGKTRT